MNQIDELQIINGLRLAQEKAVLTWYKQYQGRLTTFVARRLQSNADVEELVQETFINCLKNLPSFSGQSSLWTWMCAIAKHEVGDYYRKLYAKKALKILPMSDWLLGDFLHSANVCDDPINSNSISDLSETIEHIWQKIGSNYQELLLQKYLDQKSVNDLASARGKTCKAIESELFRARRAFKIAYHEIIK